MQWVLVFILFFSLFVSKQLDLSENYSKLKVQKLCFLVVVEVYEFFCFKFNLHIRYLIVNRKFFRCFIMLCNFGVICGHNGCYLVK